MIHGSRKDAISFTNPEPTNRPNPDALKGRACAADSDKTKPILRVGHCPRAGTPGARGRLPESEAIFVVGIFQGSRNDPKIDALFLTKQSQFWSQAEKGEPEGRL
jgi:hypothetical protein